MACLARKTFVNLMINLRTNLRQIRKKGLKESKRAFILYESCAQDLSAVSEQRLPGKNFEREHQYRTYNLEHEFECQPNNAERQQNEPDDWKNKKQKQSDGPAKD